MKISLWITIGLIISALCVSTLGAYFSILGLGALFSGAVLAVWLMAASLEFSKFILAAYIHQRWKEMSGAFKYYLTFAVVILSCITSLGIFGFLSDAYQSASTAIQSEQVKLDAEKNQQSFIKTEIARLNKAIDEVPDSRITKKMKLRAELEPRLAELTKKLEASEKNITKNNLNVIEIQKKVGPLIYISKAFNINIDTVVKYLILVFVSVFDPLAICLVIASSQALFSRRKDSFILPPQDKMNTSTKTDSSTVDQNDSTSAEVIEMTFEKPVTPHTPEQAS